VLPETVTIRESTRGTVEKSFRDMWRTGTGTIPVPDR
jgi:hypothetical protein